MSIATKITEMLKPVVADLGYELLGCIFMPNNGILRIYIDSPNGITADDCARVSGQVSGVLDVEDPIHERYELEVSSPGLDRPLFTAEQYQRFIGQTIKFRLHMPQDGQRNFTGLIKEVDGENVVIELEDSDKQFSFSSIEKANLIPDY